MTFVEKTVIIGEMLPATVRAGAEVVTIAKWRTKRPTKPEQRQRSVEPKLSAWSPAPPTLTQLTPMRAHVAVVSRHIRAVEELSCVLIPALVAQTVGRCPASPPPPAPETICEDCGLMSGLRLGSREVPPLSMMDVEALFVKQHWAGVRPRQGCILFSLPPVAAVILPSAVVLDINDQISIDTLILSLEHAADTCFASLPKPQRRRASETTHDRRPVGSQVLVIDKASFPFEAASLAVLTAAAVEAVEDEVEDIIAAVARSVSHASRQHRFDAAAAGNVTLPWS